MQIDIIQIIQIGLTIVGCATVALNIIAPLTKNKTDDKILQFLKRVLEVVSLNVNDNESVLKIKLSK